MITLPYFTNDQSKTRGGSSNLSQVTRLVGDTTRIPPVFCTTPRRPLCGTSGRGRPRRGKAARVRDADTHRPLPGLLRTTARRASSQPRPFQPRAGARRADREGDGSRAPSPLHLSPSAAQGLPGAVTRALSLSRGVPRRGSRAAAPAEPCDWRRSSSVSSNAL